jgi:AraC-like DNA-binding protein
MNVNDIPNRINFFSGQIYSACGMRGWCFDRTGKFIFTTSSHEKELLTMLEISGCLKYAYENFIDSKLPFILSDRIGLTWLGEFSYDEDMPHLLFLMGPVFISTASIKGVESALAGMNISIPVRQGFTQILQQIPVIQLSMLLQYAIMLHFTLSEETIRSNSVQFQPIQVQEREVRESEGLKYLEDNMNNEQVRSVEQMLLQFVREGQSGYEANWQQVVPVDAVDNYKTGNPLRESKNTHIIFTALCARAAIDGGLSAVTAKSMENYYISMIEKISNVSELGEIHNNMMKDFISRVAEARRNPQISQTVHQCYDFVHENLLTEFTLEDIAKAVGYTEYYLTKKFYKETGIRLVDYVKDARIEHAKIWLQTTNKTIQEISEQMHFGTRNYFSRVFREKTGMTPAAYRERMRTAVARKVD